MEPASLPVTGPAASGPGPVPPEACARAIMETIPPAMRLLRTEMRRPHQGRLSVPQFRTLVYLQRHPGASVSDVAGHLGVTLPTASALIERLVQRGLVSRERAPQERRRVVLHLTPAGTAMVDVSRRHTVARLEERLAALDPADLVALDRGLRILRAAVLEPAGDEPARSGPATPGPGARGSTPVTPGSAPAPSGSAPAVPSPDPAAAGPDPARPAEPAAKGGGLR